MSSFFGVVAKQIKSHPAVSLSHSFYFYGRITSLATMSVLALTRAALKNPDMGSQEQPEPWNQMKPNQQYKLLAVNMDYSKLKEDRPDF
uniref:Cytochrome c oxidase subunit NDUFA4 n=1 Tax=Maylandia zebra TaxID=106582 RepID=A0A3P9CB58_9CICH